MLLGLTNDILNFRLSTMKNRRVWNDSLKFLQKQSSFLYSKIKYKWFSVIKTINVIKNSFNMLPG